jgi:hypothetical protein
VLFLLFVAGFSILSRRLHAANSQTRVCSLIEERYTWPLCAVLSGGVGPTAHFLAGFIKAATPFCCFDVCALSAFDFFRIWSQTSICRMIMQHVYWRGYVSTASIWLHDMIRQEVNG